MDNDWWGHVALCYMKVRSHLSRKKGGTSASRDENGQMDV